MPVASSTRPATRMAPAGAGRACVAGLGPVQVVAADRIPTARESTAGALAGTRVAASEVAGT